MANIFEFQVKRKLCFWEIDLHSNKTLKRINKLARIGDEPQRSFNDKKDALM